MEYFQTPSKKELAEGKRKHRLEEIAEEEQKKPKKYKAEVVPLQSYFQLLPKNILEEVRECARDDSVELVLDFTRYLSDIDGKKQSSLGYSAMFKNEIYRIALCFPSKKRSQLAHADLMKEYCELEEAEAKGGEPKPEERPRPSHVLTGKYLVGGQKKRWSRASTQTETSTCVVFAEGPSSRTIPCMRFLCAGTKCFSRSHVDIPKTAAPRTASAW